MTWLVVVNPTAGAGRAKKISLDVVHLLKSRGQNYVEINEFSAFATSQAVMESVTTFSHEDSPLTGVIAVGGDGLVHLLIQCLAHTQIPLLVFPAGTGNDFVRAQRFPLDNNREILDYALTNKPHFIDLGSTERGFFVDILSTGFDSLVNERANRMKFLRGPLKYNVSILRELPFFSPRNYQFVVDNEHFETHAMLIAVANGHSYGGGMQICPQASFQDGVFDILILKPVSKAHFIRIFPRVFSGTHVSDPAVEILRGKKVTITADAIAYADGERLGPLPITTEIHENALMTWSKVPTR